jgi:hypothetical protein
MMVFYRREVENLEFTRRFFGDDIVEKYTNEIIS